MAPTLVNSYLATAVNNVNTLTTAAFTPADGEILVVKTATSDTAQTFTAPTGASLTYTQRALQTTGPATALALYTTVIGISPGSMSVSQAFASSSQYHSILVERWSNAVLAATPATVATLQGTGVAPSATLTTAAADSAVSWSIADYNAAAPTSRAYRSGAIEEAIHDGSTSWYVAYFAYQAALTAGAQTIGMTAPTQLPSIVGIEIQSGAGGGGAVAPASPWPLRSDRPVKRARFR